ncbi:MAG: MarR family winged helix-turn-helix transcriptional regulator [Minisyncoccota bacterium]
MTFRMDVAADIPRITPSQWSVLMFMEERSESTIKDVAQALGITSSAATQLVDGLVSSGYVARETHVEDRRAVTLTLPKKTKTQVKKMKERGIQKFLEIFQVLSDEEFDQYLALNKKIVRGFLA